MKDLKAVNLLSRCKQLIDPDSYILLALFLEQINNDLRARLVFIHMTKGAAST